MSDTLTVYLIERSHNMVHGWTVAQKRKTFTFLPMFSQFLSTVFVLLLAASYQECRRWLTGQGNMSTNVWGETSLSSFPNFPIFHCRFILAQHIFDQPCPFVACEVLSLGFKSECGLKIIDCVLMSDWWPSFSFTLLCSPYNTLEPMWSVLNSAVTVYDVMKWICWGCCQELFKTVTGVQGSFKKGIHLNDYAFKNLTWWQFTID